MSGDIPSINSIISSVPDKAKSAISTILVAGISAAVSISVTIKMLDLDAPVAKMAGAYATKYEANVLQKISDIDRQTEEIPQKIEGLTASLDENTKKIQWLTVRVGDLEDSGE